MLGIEVPWAFVSPSAFRGASSQVCQHPHTPKLAAFTLWHFLPHPSHGPYQSTHHIYNRFIVVSHFCIKCHFLWTGGAGRKKNVNPGSGMCSPSENIANYKKNFLLQRCPQDIIWPLKTTCRHAWEKKGGGTSLASRAEEEEMGIKMQKAAEQEWAGWGQQSQEAPPSLPTPCAPAGCILLPFLLIPLYHRPEEFPPAITEVQPQRSSPAILSTDEETKDRRGLNHGFKIVFF